MELQVCNNYEKSDTTICDKQYNFIIIILTIIYSTFISAIIFIKQPIIKEVIKEVIVEVIVEVPVEVIKEVIKEVPVEVIDKVVTEENNEEELLLANYNTKERALALQAAYEERAFIAIKKYGDVYKNINGTSYSWQNNNIDIEIISSDEKYKLINKNDIGNDDGDTRGNTKVAYDNRRYRFIMNIFSDERSKYYQEQLVIARTEALNAMKKANLFDKLFVEFLKYD